mgnify:CR=1 FL=1
MTASRSSGNFSAHLAVGASRTKGRNGASLVTPPVRHPNLNRPNPFVAAFTTYSDWSMDVTAQRLKTLSEWLETEQRKENAKPRGAGVGTSGAKILPQAAKPTWEE